ncbi:MAG: phage holin family protein [Defluviitaleaceae bacterium]|nr:phage holin family protein [Defluviitaleaceae bacterium]
MNPNDYAIPELLALAPALSLLGILLKKAPGVDDAGIPIILGLAGSIAAVLYAVSLPVEYTRSEWITAIVSAAAQGALAAGASVYGHQIWKQAGKGCD